MQDKNDLQLFVPINKQNKIEHFWKRKEIVEESKVVGGTLAPLPKSVFRRRPLHHPFNQRKKELFLGRLALDSTNIQGSSVE